MKKKILVIITTTIFIISISLIGYKYYKNNIKIIDNTKLNQTIENNPFKG